MKNSLPRLMALFAGCVSAHGTHGAPERDPDGLKWNIKRTARTLREPVTEDVWQQHVDGKRPLGVIPIREDSTCSWGSIDFDVYDVDLLDIVRRVEEAKLPLLPCVSKSGGLHLFLFLDRPEPAGDVQRVLRDLAASLGMAECEIFPKQTQVLTERNDLGNWMVMPYFGDTFGGKLRMQRGLKKTGAEMTVGEFVAAGEKLVTSMSALVALCEKRRSTSTQQPRGGKGSKKSNGSVRGSPADFSDGPPCLQHLSGGVLTDGRKRYLFMSALYMKRADPAKWRERLEQLNQTKCKPPLVSEEVTGIIRSLGKKDYEYTCKEEPMRSHCDSALCRTRRLGVGRGGEYPVISSISKLKTTPPVWFVDVEGHRVELSTDELQTYMKFHKACLDKVDKSYRMMKQDAWLALLAEALENLQSIDAPPEASTEGILFELLEEFLTNRQRGTRKEDILSGRPVEIDGYHYFQLKSFLRFLEKSGSRMPQEKVTSKLRDFGVEWKQWPLAGGRKRNVWLIASDKVTPPPEAAPRRPETKQEDF